MVKWAGRVAFGESAMGLGSEVPVAFLNILINWVKTVAMLRWPVVQPRDG
jgi:hypothetical protein